MLLEICWINRTNNPADTITKTTPNKALEGFIDTNELRVRVKKEIKRN
jgi:hypothetical protein